MLYKLILGPLELLFDVIYAWAMQLIHNPGLSIIFLSLAINLLVLPLYKRADAVQEEERQTAARLKPGIDHIKKVFKGDERVMILQTYYRQNNYKPYYALKGTLSLLLEIPFFIAAYNYLSHLQLIQGVSFGPIANLGAPDGLLKIGGLTVNLLPVLMTAINIVSGAIYTKGMPLKSKIQLYGMALVFLVLLYDSPAGLVFYWTLNNLFSLGKNIVFRIWPPKKAEEETGAEKPKHLKSVFYAACIALTLLCGVLIPSAVIKSSPGEFVDAAAVADPLRYVLQSLLLSAGTFLIWGSVYYRLAKKSSRGKYGLIAAMAAFGAAVNFMFFGKDYGNLSSTLRYDIPIPVQPVSTYLLNVGILILLCTLLWFLWKKQEKLLSVLCVAAAIAIACMSGMNLVEIRNKYTEIEKASATQTTEELASFTLDKKGKNVVVLMTDRAISGFVPYIFNEKPELYKQFTGFTYYPNTLSYGGHTNVASPALYGGYEYTPDEIQKRDDVYLEEKQNEALKIMPVNFDENGFEVTVCDPPYANYFWTPDLSIYDDYPAIRKFNTQGAFTENKGEIRERQDHLRNRNLFCYSLMRSSPVLLHRLLYDTARYNEAVAAAGGSGSSTGANGETEETEEAPREISEDDPAYDDERDAMMDAYWALSNLSYMTQVTEDGKNTFLMFSNDLTHDVSPIPGPEYDPAVNAKDFSYDESHKVKTTKDGQEITLAETWQGTHYACNVAAFLQIGKWLDYLKENGVYDNTRIIIVADHGKGLGYFGLKLSPDCPEWQDIQQYNPLLMVKDFNQTGELKTDNSFMTNADTPFLAFKDFIAEPKNPFLQKTLSDEAKRSGEQHIMETNWRTDENDDTTFADPQYLVFKGDNIFNLDNWTIQE